MAALRPDGRQQNELRHVQIQRNYSKHAEGSVLIKYGDTHVICTASVVPGVPRFLKGTGQGWLTAEYGMLPRSTGERMDREATRGKQGGRTLEIQRLIGRALRSAVDLRALGENTLTIDCDVIQADGGTRTASITGACVAVYDAIRTMKKRGMVNNKEPFRQFIASISVGIYRNLPILDLNYVEDSNADTDMNVVMTEENEFIEIQGTAEGKPFIQTDLMSMLELAENGLKQLIQIQRKVVGL